MGKGAGFDGSPDSTGSRRGKESSPFFSREHRTNQKHVRRATGQNIGIWWDYIDDLIAHGHGPLQNILDNYTLTHLNKFLHKIDARRRRDRIQSIYNLRIAQATLKGFKEAIRSLEQRDRDIRRAEARAEGRRPDLEMSDYEAEVLETQRQDYFSDWSSSERERFKAEQANLWSTIPEKFRAKAEALARGQVF